MCSIDDGQLSMPKKEKIDLMSKKCKKCSEPAVVVVKVSDAYCKLCFQQYTVHKLRSAFGKSRAVRDGEKVLLAFSGGAASLAMLHLITEGRSERNQRKLRFTPDLIYINECAIAGLSQDERRKHAEAVVAHINNSGLNSFIVSLDEVFNDDVSPVNSKSFLNEESSMSHGAETNSRVQELLDQGKSRTAKENLLHSLRIQLLAQTALKLGYQKVLLGDSATRLSIRLLSNITQGRGAHLPFEMSFTDERLDGVTFLRPMREFSNEEVELYNQQNNLSPVAVTSVLMDDAGNSLEQLTEEFVCGLQADYPNTVSTIFRTGEKMSLGATATSATSKRPDDTQTCCLCHAPLDTDVPICSAMSSIALSQSLSKKLPVETNDKDDTVGLCCNAEKTSESCGPEKTGCCGEGDGSCGSTGQQLSREALCECLCYGCQLVVRDVDDLRKMPNYVIHEAARRKRRTEMKASIEDFLLEDS